MTANHRYPHAAFAWILTIVLLTLTSCDGAVSTPYAVNDGLSLPMSTQISEPCAVCDQATMAVIQTQEKNNANNQAAGTAEIVRANAQATLNSANTTLSAAQTQDQNNANLIAAQLAGTAEIVRANAQATLNSASSTQVAALTQSQFNLQGTIAAGTQSAGAMSTQQNKNDLAAGTQTSVANIIATQTQAGAATSQWYADQERQRDEQRQGPIDFLWMWCLPIFVVLLAGFVLWGFWRWLKIQQANQRILESPVEKLPALGTEIADHRHILPYLESEIIESVSQVTKPDDEVHAWLDDVKNTLLDSEKKDDDDNPDN